MTPTFCIWYLGILGMARPVNSQLYIIVQFLRFPLRWEWFTDSRVHSCFTGTSGFSLLFSRLGFWSSTTAVLYTRGFVPGADDVCSIIMFAVCALLLCFHFSVFYFLCHRCSHEGDDTLCLLLSRTSFLCSRYVQYFLLYLFMNQTLPIEWWRKLLVKTYRPYTYRSRRSQRDPPQFTSCFTCNEEHNRFKHV